MGKKGSEENEHKEPAPAPDSGKKQEKKAKKDATDGQAAKGKLSMLRPKERVFFFVAFLAVNVWFAMVYDPCMAARKKKRTDCGWSGVSAIMCRTGACFMQPGTSDTFTVEVVNPKKLKYGMKVIKTPQSDVYVKEIVQEGIITTHNSWSFHQKIMVGDRITKLNGHSGANIQSELARKKEKAKFEISRPSSAIARNMPSFLNEHIAGQVLKSAGFERWLDAFSHIGGVGVFSWFLSGYPVASLPVYYLGVSAFTSWYTVKCCHDEKGAKSGDPHCFSHSITDFKTSIALAVNQTTRKRAENFFGWVP